VATYGGAIYTAVFVGEKSADAVLEAKKPGAKVTLNELLAKVEECARRTWDLEKFVVIETELRPTWWGGQRRVVVADVGWERARIALFVRERDAKIVGNIFVGHPIPRGQLTPITEQEALDIALAECRRLKYTLRGECAVSKSGDVWHVRTNKDWIGCHAWFQIDALTGVVLDRYYLRR
jgi:hypothetical protein